MGGPRPFEARDSPYSYGSMVPTNWEKHPH